MVAKNLLDSHLRTAPLQIRFLIYGLWAALHFITRRFSASFIGFVNFDLSFLKPKRVACILTAKQAQADSRDALQSPDAHCSSAR